MPADLRVTRLFDLPAAIVWDALVDPVLLEGWLGDADFDPVEGAPARIGWRDEHHGADLDGTVVQVVPGESIAVADAAGTLTLLVTSLPGGARDSSSRVDLAVAGDSSALRADAAHWRTHLEALEDLLRGHPVVWERWDADYGAFTARLAAASAAPL